MRLGLVLHVDHMTAVWWEWWTTWQRYGGSDGPHDSGMVGVMDQVTVVWWEWCNDLPSSFLSFLLHLPPTSPPSLVSFLFSLPSTPLSLNSLLLCLLLLLHLTTHSTKIGISSEVLTSNLRPPQGTGTSGGSKATTVFRSTDAGDTWPQQTLPLRLWFSCKCQAEFSFRCRS